MSEAAGWGALAPEGPDHLGRACYQAACWRLQSASSGGTGSSTTLPPWPSAVSGQTWPSQGP
eukprot:6289311-Alexandrium_andersonii.AAC.1